MVELYFIQLNQIVIVNRMRDSVIKLSVAYTVCYLDNAMFKEQTVYANQSMALKDPSDPSIGLHCIGSTLKILSKFANRFI